MAERRIQLTFGGRAGIAAAAVVLALTLGTLAAVALRAEGGTAALTSADWAAIRFTLLQAFLSAVLSVALAVPVARALARRRFAGRGLLVMLMGAPFILPVIVAILGLLAVFGRNGVLSVILGWFGLPPVQIYGLHGVVLAHVFFNLPLATRLILQEWLAIPAERFRLAAALGFGPRDIARVLEWPMLRAVLPGAFMVIFVICTTSFAVVLALGGGPRATTVELAIYQAFRFDFDLSHAAVLALVQFVICAVAGALAWWAHVPEATGGGLDRVVERYDLRGRRGLGAVDAAWVLLASVFLLLPLGMVVVRGLDGLFSLPPTVWKAALRSLIMALAAAGLVLLWALPIAFAVWQLRGRWPAGALETVGYLSVAASPLVMGTGLFILMFPITDPVALALPVTVVVNAAMSLPFALRALVPAVAEVEGRFGPLADSLGMRGAARLRLLHWPRLRRPVGFAAGLAAALSMGDLGVITLFADPGQATLPLEIYRLMSAYRMDQAAGAGLVLLIFSLALFWLFDRGGRVDADA